MLVFVKTAPVVAAEQAALAAGPSHCGTLRSA